MSNVGELLEERVSPDMLGAVRAVALAAARLRMPLYLVGGTVRDILLSTRCRIWTSPWWGTGPMPLTGWPRDSTDACWRGRSSGL